RLPSLLPAALALPGAAGSRAPSASSPLLPASAPSREGPVRRGRADPGTARLVVARLAKTLRPGRNRDPRDPLLRAADSCLRPLAKGSGSLLAVRAELAHALVRWRYRLSRLSGRATVGSLARRDDPSRRAHQRREGNRAPADRRWADLPAA